MHHGGVQPTPCPISTRPAGPSTAGGQPRPVPPSGAKSAPALIGTKLSLLYVHGPQPSPWEPRPIRCVSTRHPPPSPIRGMCESPVAPAHCGTTGRKRHSAKSHLPPNGNLQRRAAFGCVCTGQTPAPRHSLHRPTTAGSGWRRPRSPWVQQTAAPLRAPRCDGFTAQHRLPR